MNIPSHFIKARIAVIIFFAVNGFLFANWTSRLPEIEIFYNISHGQLGSILFSSAIGSVIAMPVAGYLNNLFGSRIMTIVGGFFFICLVPCIVLYPSLYLIYPVVFLLGMAGGTLDVSMNGQAVIVERAWNKSIMSFFHAMFSIGMVAGAGTGALAANFGIPLLQHILMAFVVAFLLLLWASNNLIHDRNSAEESNGDQPNFSWPTAAILPIAFIAFCGMTGEGSLMDWSALFMNEIVGASEAVSAAAFGTFGGAMTIGRLVGDKFTDRWGSKKMLIIESILSITGLTIALVFPTMGMVFLGFFITGIGLSNIVPIVYSKAGNTPGVKPAVGIAMATTVGYAGFFIGPPIIGFLADAYDLRVALCFTLILFLIMATIILKQKSI